MRKFKNVYAVQVWDESETDVILGIYTSFDLALAKVNAVTSLYGLVGSSEVRDTEDCWRVSTLNEKEEVIDFYIKEVDLDK